MIERHLAMLGQIPRQPRKTTVAELHAKLSGLGFVTSQRTIERDLHKLARFGLTCDQGRPAGWSWLRSAHPGALAPMGIDNALALMLVQRYLAAVLPPQLLATMERQFEQARRALELQQGAPPGRWSSRVAVLGEGPPLQPPAVDPDVFAAIGEALLSGRQLQLTYRAIGGAGSRRHVLHPLGLVHRAGTSYLVATAGEYETPHNFALQRMSEPQVLAHPAREPDGFSLDAYVNGERAFEWPRGETVVLELAANEWLARHLEERRLSDDQVIAADGPPGRFHVRATVAATEQLWWWLRSLGPAVEILAPAFLRQRFAEELQALSGRYAGVAPGSADG